MSSWHVYILKCSDNSLYTGITTDIKRRLKEHNEGKGSKSVLGKRPVEVVYTESSDNQTEAAKREREIKSWSRNKKIDLVEGFSQRRKATKTQ